MVFLRYLDAVRKHFWVLMSCAIFTMLGAWILYADKNNAWAIRATFAVAGFCLFLACFMAWRDEHKSLTTQEDRADRSQEKLDAIPLNLQIEIIDVFHRASFETPSYWDTDFFHLVSSSLGAPQSADIEYCLELIMQGKTIATKWIRDIDLWCRLEIVDPDPYGTRRDGVIPYLIDELPPHLQMGKRVDGWLHFRLEGVSTDGVFAKCKLRLIASSKYGATHDERAEGGWPIIRKDARIVLKTAYSGSSPENPQPEPM